MDRRKFMATSMGLATCFLAQNKVYGQAYDVDEAETYEEAATAEKWPKDEYFIIDVQSHFTHGYVLPFRNDEFIKNMGFNLKNDVEAYSFKNYVKELFFDSDTNMVVISGVPGRELQKDAKTGEKLEGAKRGGGILPSWLMSQAGKEINELAGSERALWQGNLAPNHYWDKANNKPDKTAILDQMDRELNMYGIRSWKWYCHADPGASSWS